MNTEQERAQLLPCPFCGGEATLKQYRSDGLRIECQSCRIRYEQRWLYKNRDWLTAQMAKTWNTRVALQSQSMPPEISRDLLGRIVDQLFGGAIEDTTVIEDIYRVIACEFALQSQSMPAKEWLKELAAMVDLCYTREEILSHASKHPALQSQDREDAPFLQESDQHDLHRFIETTEDGEGYDIGKDRIKRLAELGVVSNHGFGRYSVTAFGYWCHENHWHQNPSLPLKTIDERNAQASIDHARRIEGEA